jgi:WD40 repeat protein
VLRDHSDAVTAVAFSPDGKSVYTASLDHNVRRFESDSGKLVRTFTGHNDAVLALTITADGKGLISSGQEPPLRWWNPDTGDTTSIQYGPNGPVNGLSLSPDGKYLVSAGSDGSVRLWETGSRNDVHTFTAGETWQFAAACAPGGKLAAGAGADGVIRLWDVAGQKLRIAIAAWPPVKSGGACEWIALTPEGYFDGSQGWVSALRIRPDNRAIALPLAVIQPLHRPSEVLKAWHDADLQAASLALSPANVSQKAETAPKFPKPSTARGR